MTLECIFSYGHAQPASDGGPEALAMTAIAFRSLLRRARDCLRLRGPLAGDPTGQMFHVLLVLVAVWMAAGAVITLRLAPIAFERIFLPILLQASLAAALLALRMGRLRLASIIYLAGTWLWATTVMQASGGIYTHALALYSTMPISAAWLLGYSAALRTAGVCIATMFFFVCLEMFGHTLVRHFTATPLGIWFVAVQATLIGTIPVGQVLKRLLETLRELQAYKEGLEALVDQRTAELVKARDEAEAANRAKSVFLANMSHELRTPLNAILGFSQLLRSGDASEQQRHDLDIINRSGEHLLGLIDDVLDVAKVEAGAAELHIAACDLKELVEDVTGIVRDRALRKGLKLDTHIPQPCPIIRTDAARLRQVLINLLTNAIKFTHQGSVTLRVSALSETSRELLLTFDVEDTGEGISAADQGVIFDVFVQASATRRDQGVGLGLTISSKIIDLMG
ncbi:MAG TPA: histidine kinase dimerization/phospho-acceptor domain-containing protein, partial [Terriglobales bacterium]